jgi:hypothetical protein
MDAKECRMLVLGCRWLPPLAALITTLVWAVPAQAQISKVDCRDQGGSGLPAIFPRVDWHDLLGHGICPSCKRNYCPLYMLGENYGYTPPRWHPFPGTTPTYTPKRRDIGISEPAAAPPAAGAALPPAPAGPPAVPNADLAEAPPRARDVPSFPISPAGKSAAPPDK